RGWCVARWRSRRGSPLGLLTAGFRPERRQRVLVVRILGPAPRQFRRFILQEVGVCAPLPLLVPLLLEGMGPEDIGEQVRGDRLLDGVGLREGSWGVTAREVQEPDM